MRSYSLPVRAGKLQGFFSLLQVWSLRVEVTILDHGGGLADAIGMACLAALLTHRRPVVSKVARGLQL